MAEVKIVVGRHADGFVAYPPGVAGAVIGQGDTFEAALDDVTSALRFHIETFGNAVLDPDDPVLDAVIVEAAPAR